VAWDFISTARYWAECDGFKSGFYAQVDCGHDERIALQVALVIGYLDEIDSSFWMTVESSAEVVAYPR
jgi:hypothetical protein